MEAINIGDFKNNRIKESDLIKRILGGEKELYEILVRENNQKLYRIIRAYLKVEEEIEDTMQNSYLKAFSHLSEFKLESAFSTWLIRIGINESLARLQENGKRQAVEKRIDDFNSNYTLEVPDYKQLNPEGKMIEKETKQLLENAMDQLDSKYKVVYILKELEDMSLKEIALALDLTVSNVKVRLLRSKEMLKEKLFDQLNDRNIFEFGFGRCDRLTENVMRNI